jgi:hypothetical protein
MSNAEKVADTRGWLCARVAKQWSLLFFSTYRREKTSPPGNSDSQFR